MQPQKTDETKEEFLNSFLSKKYLGFIIVGISIFFMVFSFYGAEFYRARYRPEISPASFFSVRLLVGCVSGVISYIAGAIIVGYLYAIIRFLTGKARESSSVFVIACINLTLTLISVLGVYFGIKIFHFYNPIGEAQLVVEEYFGCLFAALIGSYGGAYLTIFFAKNILKLKAPLK